MAAHALKERFSETMGQETEKALARAASTSDGVIGIPAHNLTH
jgi:hypothetical protein